MFGYACRETPELMPAPILYSHKILHLLAIARKSGKEPKLGPDAKSQVTLHYVDGKPVTATQIVLSTQHLDENMTSNDVRRIVEPYIHEAMPGELITDKTIWHVNPTGAFVVGGPDGDCGSPAARSSWTLMAAQPRMAAARSPARIPRRWTVRPPMPRAISRRMWWRRDWPIAARSRFPMPSACPISAVGLCRSARHGQGR